MKRSTLLSIMLVCVLLLTACSNGGSNKNTNKAGDATDAA